MERYLHTWKGRLNIVKMSVLLNLMCRFNTMPIKIPANYFMYIDKLLPKLMWRGKRSKIANTILKEKRKVGRLTLPYFKS